VRSSRLPAEMETMLYRVVQEALTNVARHAQAQHVGIMIERRPGRVTAIIEDDGTGFDVAEAEQRGRLGLLGMRERTQMLGGKLTIESAVGKGTTIFVDIPLTETG
jgi:signal transduction histidine kinase